MVQAAAVRGSFHSPQRFWLLMTSGLAGSGLLVAPTRSRRATSASWLAIGAGLGAVGYGATLTASRLVSRWEWGRRSLIHFRSCTASVPKPLAAALILPAALGEEWFWREGVIVTLGQREPRRGRLLAQATAGYALVQTAALDPLPPAGALLLGVVTGGLRLASGSVWPALAAHLVFSELTLVAPGLATGEPGSVTSTGTEL